MRIFSKIVAIIATVFKKTKGMIAWLSVSWVYDVPIWMGAQLYFGPESIWALVAIAILGNLLMLRKYEKEKVSWLLWDEAVNYLKEKPIKTYFKTVSFLGIVLWVGASSFVSFVIFMGIIFIILVKIIFKFRVLEDIFMFFFLSIKQDMFTCTSYLKHGRVDGFSKRDAIIFSASTVVCLGWWAAFNWFLIEILIRPVG